MRRMILGAVLAALASGGLHAARADAPPYAPSTAVTGFAWDPSTIRSAAWTPTSGR